MLRWCYVGVIGIILAGFTSPVLGGAWVQPYQGGYLQMTSAYIAYDQLHQHTQPPLQLPYTVRDITFKAYAEYGISPHLTLLAEVPYKVVMTEVPLHTDHDFSNPISPGKLQGWSNIKIGGRYQIYRYQGWSITCQSRGIIPAFNQNVEKGLQMGYATWGGELQLQAGYSETNWYLMSQIGGQVWHKYYSSRGLFQIEGGLKGKGGWQGIATIDIWESFYDRKGFDANFRQTGLFVNNREVVALTLKVHKSFNEHWGAILAAAGGYPAYHMPTGIVVMGNVYYQWN